MRLAERPHDLKLTVPPEYASVSRAGDTRHVSDQVIETDLSFDTGDERGSMIWRARAVHSQGKLFDAAVLARTGTPRPIAVKVGADSSLSVVEVTAAVLAQVVGGQQVETVSSRAGIGFWFDPRNQHYEVNMMATLLLLATCGLPSRSVPLLYGPVVVAAHDRAGGPAGLSRMQIRMLAGRTAIHDG